MDLFGDTPAGDLDDANEYDAYANDDSLLQDVSGPSVKPPQESDLFLGHEDIEKKCLRLWNDGRMPHAIVLNGLKGVGKATFAFRLARFVLKESANGGGGLFGDDIIPETLAISPDDPVFRKIQSGGHTDCLVISRPFDEKKGEYKNDIPVEEIRKIAPFLRNTSGDGGWRVVIVDDADTMNRNGQNALLKILEEPPKKTLLILVTHGAGGLLPTIRSRCRFMTFDALPDAIIEDLLHKAAGALPLMPDDLDILTSMAQGSAGQAISLLQNGGMETVRSVLDCFMHLDRATAGDIDNYALSFGKSGSKDVLDLFVYTVHWWFDRLVRMLIDGRQAENIGHQELKVPPQWNLQSVLSLHETIDEHIKSCQIGTLDTRYMIFKTLILLQRG